MASSVDLKGHGGMLCVLNWACVVSPERPDLLRVFLVRNGHQCNVL